MDMSGKSGKSFFFPSDAFVFYDSDMCFIGRGKGREGKAGLYNGFFSWGYLTTIPCAELVVCGGVLDCYYWDENWGDEVVLPRMIPSHAFLLLGVWEEGAGLLLYRYLYHHHHHHQSSSSSIIIIIIIIVMVIHRRDGRIYSDMV
jgi:hypothetical protein